MKQTDRAQSVLNWLEKEKKKDELELKLGKEKFINEIKKINKQDLFVKSEQPVKKVTIWQRIKQMIWGI
jgi:hypothetical protein